jgi:hypothetical protein
MEDVWCRSKRTQLCHPALHLCEGSLQPLSGNEHDETLALCDRGTGSLVDCLDGKHILEPLFSR